MNCNVDRRRERSSDTLVALYYQLSHTHREASLDTIVVADTSGLVVAGAGTWAACEELAAFAPLLAQGDSDGLCRSEHVRLSELAPDVDVKPIDVGGQIVLLCVRGAKRREAAVDRAAQGVARILTNAA